MTIGLVITLGSAVFSALHWFCVSASCLFLYSSQASYLLFQCLFCIGSLSYHCLHYHLMLIAYLLFHTLLLVHPDYLYLACLTMLGHFLVLQKCLKCERHGFESHLGPHFSLAIGWLENNIIIIIYLDLQLLLFFSLCGNVK